MPIFIKPEHFSKKIKLDQAVKEVELAIDESPTEF